jgi:hypothetical protein
MDPDMTVLDAGDQGSFTVTKVLNLVENAWPTLLNGLDDSDGERSP